MNEKTSKWVMAVIELGRVILASLAGYFGGGLN